jgi:hypothetical protein
VKKVLKKTALATVVTFFACNAYAQNENKTNLSCAVKLTVYDKTYGEQKYEEKFDVEIFDDKDGISVLTSNSAVGASISFGKRSYGRTGNVKNLSNESKIHFAYDALQPDGSVFSTKEFRINRYTGSIYISDKSKFLNASSEGACNVIKQKMF